MDLKLKYQNSFFGFFWSFFKPLLQFLIYWSVFDFMLGVSRQENYPLALFYGVLIWSWFSEATSLGLNSLIGKKSIITKVKINKMIPPLSAFLTPTMSHVLNFLIFLIVYFMFGKHLNHFWNIYNISVFLYSFLCLSILITAINLILANLNVLFRDIQQIWELVLVYGVFLTPVIYKIPIPEKYEVLYYSVNLLAYPLQNFKSVFFANQFSLVGNLKITFFYWLSLSLLVFFAVLIYRKLSIKIVDLL
jgi:ABC-type polysaccharide/polyol phosphate export permease